MHAVHHHPSDKIAILTDLETLVPPTPNSKQVTRNYTSILCYVWDRNQMQTRMDAEIVVYSEQSREPGDQKFEVQNGRQKCSQSNM